MNSPRPQRSKFDLICGMILGGLVVGITLPAASSYLGDHDTKAVLSLKSRVLLPNRAKISDPPVLRSTLSRHADAQPTRTEVMADSKLSQTEVQPADTIAPNAKPPLIETVEIDSKKEKKTKRSKNLAVKREPRSAFEEKASTQSLEELSDAPAKKPTVSTAKLSVIPNAQYSKEHLDKCPKKCVVKSKDAFGKTIFAVINGPEFADVLRDHQGTINMVGEKRVVKNLEVFLVQSITFNLSSRATAKTSVPENLGSKGQADQGWEDLSEM
jgi:hypothetical protein